VAINELFSQQQDQETLFELEKQESSKVEARRRWDFLSGALLKFVVGLCGYSWELQIWCTTGGVAIGVF
ncbi:MAG: hypothetical protein ACI8RD_000124, partial [Bacillariaceae sp.]|jgi:hypothetical protein